MLYCIRTVGDTEFTAHIANYKQAALHIAGLGHSIELVHCYTNFEYGNIPNYILNRLDKVYDDINILSLDLAMLNYTSIFEARPQIINKLKTTNGRYRFKNINRLHELIFNLIFNFSYGVRYTITYNNTEELIRYSASSCYQELFQQAFLYPETIIDLSFEYRTI